MQGFTFAVVLEQGVKISLHLLCFRKRRQKIAYVYCVFFDCVSAGQKIAYVYCGFVSVGQKSLTFTVFFVIS